jgi:hypothetical protein
MIQTLLPPTAKRDRAYFSAALLRLTLSLLMLETWAVRLHEGGVQETNRRQITCVIV